MQLRTLALTTILCAGAMTPLVAQAHNTSRTGETSTEPTGMLNISPPGPRLSTPFQRFEPRLARNTVSANDSLAAEGGQHVIVISTLALVLAAVVVVLLVAR